MPQKTVYLALGTNIGERQANLERALALLQREGIQISKRSSIYETEPQERTNQPWFLNMVIECETTFFPLQLLKILHRIEREMGRRREAGARFGPRVIDLDILLFGNAAIDTPRLAIPHPRMLQRRFVLEPLAEIAPKLRHPVTKELFAKYLDELTGQAVKKVTP